MKTKETHKVGLTRLLSSTSFLAAGAVAACCVLAPLPQDGAGIVLLKGTLLGEAGIPAFVVVLGALMIFRMRNRKR